MLINPEGLLSCNNSHAKKKRKKKTDLRTPSIGQPWKKEKKYNYWYRINNMLFHFKRLNHGMPGSQAIKGCHCSHLDFPKAWLDFSCAIVWFMILESCRAPFWVINLLPRIPADVFSPLVTQKKNLLSWYLFLFCILFSNIFFHLTLQRH